MFSRKRKAERTAAQAWDYLSAAMAAAGESAREAGVTASDLAGRASSTGGKLAGKTGKKGGQLADKASSKATAAGNEAWARANAAANALAGRKPGLPFGLIVGFSLIGIAVGWAAASTVRAALARQGESEQAELAETAVVVTPTYGD